MVSRGTFRRRAQAMAAPMVPIEETACQPPIAVCSGTARANRMHTSKPTMNAAMTSAGRRAGALGERQQRRDDRRGRLAQQRGDVVVHDVGGDAVGERRKLRRGAERLADHRHLGRRALLLHHFADDLGALLAAAGEHHRHGVDEGEARALDGERRQRLDVEADDEIGDGVAELSCAASAGFASGLLSCASADVPARPSAPAAPSNSRRSISGCDVMWILPR